jgi:hypothetical protein
MSGRDDDAGFAVPRPAEVVFAFYRDQIEAGSG